MTSNAGHVLFAGAATEAQAAGFAALCDSPDFAATWGLRTVAAGTPRFNPMGYHTGSIWPHDASLTVAGLCRYGEKRRAARLAEGLFAASREVRLRGLPELCCGLDAGEPPRLVSYPSACSTQAWAAGSPFLCLKALIGLDIDMTREGEPVTLADPWLPDGIDRLDIERLPVAAAGRASIRVERTGSERFQSEVALTGDKT
ncbi:hypothetical protein [Maritimibacter sp. DP1N21-5]|uniref:MGH1-like glycoside hydrolase domain-containing protein n=1 Tax=Maritimibacter sp. DP1N21-5 TaxID=2836867 RepID=UPI001C476E8B|nr:hypothetical protein [Maritimibacter sp. DP1N21-5]MBV7410082.1 hypothetical protein [Maritimibacter sp. DP1N21-5]